VIDHKVSIRSASDDDLDILSVLNRQLIEDERHDNNMSIEQLRSRMKSFIHTDYQAFLFEVEEKVVGYALVNQSTDPVYLRQFFICREHRRKGYGTQAFRLTLGAAKADRMDVDVLVWNHRGIKFWRSLGFEDRGIQMRLSACSPKSEE